MSSLGDQAAYDFVLLLTATREELLSELAVTHTVLANLHEQIAYERATEISQPAAKSARIISEGHRDALIEKKFLIIRLLETPRASSSD